MKIVDWAVFRPIGTAILTLVVLVFGLVGFRELAIDLLPAVDMPRISITTAYQGVAPEEIETLITRPIEQSVSTIQGVSRIESTSAEGVSRIQLQFEWGAELSDAVNDVRAQLDRIRPRLPEQADPPMVFKFDLSAASVATLGVSGWGDAPRLRHLVDDELARRLERVAGVAAVDVRGGRIREIRVELEASRLAALGLSPSAVSAAIAAENRSVSAGDMQDGGSEVAIRVEGEFAGVDDVANTVIATREGRGVRVADVARVIDSVQEVRDELWVDGVPGIRVRVSKQSGANTVEVVEGIRTEVEAINRDYQARLHIAMLQDSGKFIEDAIGNVMTSAALGGGLAVIVLLLFLHSVRATLVIAIAIPFSITATFALMYFNGITLNLISFGGLALGIGMLVDNAIVILENIYRKHELGYSANDAAIAGAHEVTSAVVAGTLTTVAVFVPVLFIGGFAGVFFAEMAVVVCFALLCSLAVAVTLVPSLLARLLKGRQSHGGDATSVLQHWSTALERGYGQLVQRAVRRPWTVVAVAAALFVAAVPLVELVGTELMPETDEARLDASLELPVGTPLETTGVVVKEMARRVRAVLEEHELEHIAATAGPETWWKPAGSNQGSLEIMLSPPSRRARSTLELAPLLQRDMADIPGAEVRVRPASSNLLLRIMRGGGDDRLYVAIRGHDLQTADRLAAEVRTAMSRVEGITDTRVDRELGQLERVVRVNRARLGELGMGARDVANALEHYVLGFVPTRLREAGDEFDIRVVLREQDRDRIDQLGSLPIVASDGRIVPLSSIAEVIEHRGPSSISREDQERVLKVSAGLGTRNLGDIVAALHDQLATVTVPAGFTLNIAGEMLEQQRAFSGLFVGLLLAIFLVYAVMAVQFESLRGPFIVMVSVPFAFVGVVLVLLATNTTLNMNSLLGTLILVGIVVNNAIVLVDYADLLRKLKQLSVEHAIVEAGRTRLRPILMTTATTVLGMLPLALSFGEGSELQAPLARALLGGLVWSTMVSLIVVPCAYLLVERRRQPV